MPQSPGEEPDYQCDPRRFGIRARATALGGIRRREWAEGTSLSADGFALGAQLAVREAQQAKWNYSRSALMTALASPEVGRRVGEKEGELGHESRRTILGGDAGNGKMRSGQAPAPPIPLQ